MGPCCSCAPPPQRAVTRVLCCVLCSVLGRLALGPGHPSSPPISPTTVFNAIGNVVVCQCGRGGPSQVSAGAGRAWASHRTLCCNHVHAAPSTTAVVHHPLPCRRCARAEAAATDRGYRNSNIYLATHTCRHPAGAHASAPPGDHPPGKWLVCVAATCNIQVDDGCPPCVSPGAASPPPHLKFTGPPFWRSPLQLWLPSEVFSTRMAGGPGCTRHPQATTFGGPLLPLLWTHGPGLVVGTGVAPPPARSPRAYRCEQGVNVDGCTRNPLMGTRGTFPDPVNPLTGCAKPLTGRQR